MPGLLASKLVMSGNVGGGVIGLSQLAKWVSAGVRGSAGASPSRHSRPRALAPQPSAFFLETLSRMPMASSDAQSELPP